MQAVEEIHIREQNDTSHHTDNCQDRETYDTAAFEISQPQIHPEETSAPSAIEAVGVAQA
jgi:hypothetical protein